MPQETLFYVGISIVSIGTVVGLVWFVMECWRSSRTHEINYVTANGKEQLKAVSGTVLIFRPLGTNEWKRVKPNNSRQAGHIKAAWCHHFSYGSTVVKGVLEETEVTSVSFDRF